MSVARLLTLFSIFCVIFYQKVSGYPTYVEDMEPVNIAIDPDSYEEYMKPVIMSPLKRFFTNHPSDYNPMRRPGPLPRGSKRDDGVPFHPVPRVVTASMRHPAGDDFDNSDGYIESGRQKKQTRAATLIFRLGSLGMRRKPTVPPGPTV